MENGADMKPQSCRFPLERKWQVTPTPTNSIGLVLILDIYGINMLK